ncbi:hypothetical protein HK100_004537 [Physocladia obscura]|uniref:U1-type domain-containing protein n=1 Tax=Physocladia obscura TaxID=109957 RepID=A0AAD5T8S0_9FUNG|nr:hypothetical protein HK100_004537 [Physocladia obscura]
MSQKDKKGFYTDAAKGGDTGFRRTWDKAEYSQKAREREENASKNLRSNKDHKNDAPEQLLKQREGAIDFEAKINKTVVVQSGSADHQPGFFCSICNILCKDNINYLDHLNGVKHQRNLGQSMKVERSTADQVKARIEALTKKRKDPEPELNLAARVKLAVDTEEAAKKAKKEEKKRKKEAKIAATDADSVVDPDMTAMMGFGGFGSSKK